jgi:hypothetical protein
MTPKKRLSKHSPSYYVPLPYALAIKRQLDDESFEAVAFEGMKLDFKVEGVINQSIAVVVNFEENEIVLGYIPKGMLSRIEGLMMHEDKVLISLEKKYCPRLKQAFWICIDELPDLPPLF